MGVNELFVSVRVMDTAVFLVNMTILEKSSLEK